jgi:hypothetical protein
LSVSSHSVAPDGFWSMIGKESMFLDTFNNNYLDKLKPLSKTWDTNYLKNLDS